MPARTGSFPTARWRTASPARRIPTSPAATCPLPSGVDMRWADAGRLGARHDRLVEHVRRASPAGRHLARARATSARPPTTATPTCNLNYAESGGNVNRQYFAQAGNANILLVGRPHEGALPLAADGPEPSVQERPAAQGRLHVLEGPERGRRRRLGGPDVEPAVADRPQLRARRLRPSAHAPDGLRLRTAVRSATRRACCR